ncbi:MAG: ferritin-like domain-containing protein [Gemmatimonadota bacterium]|nr:ferritin-like domain-containing protein [Gemmatimonadota bacterium]
MAACLDALRAACAEYNVEMIAVYPADAPLPERIRDEYRDVRVLFAPPGTLVPVLWAEGFRVSSGGVVAFTTGHCVVGPVWARSLLEAIDQGVAGAGGALALNGDDSGVRAYKGQGGNVMGNDAVLTAALQIHSVEARHASQIRRLRGEKGWITGSSRGSLPPQAQAVYDGEANTMQGGRDAAPLGANAGGAAAVSEAFDEPLGMQEVLNIIRPFLAG